MKKLKKMLSVSFIAVFLFSIVGFNNINVQAIVSGQAIVDYARTLVSKHIPYRPGGTDETGFDCSGFTQYVYAHFGITIGRDTYAQVLDGTTVTGSLEPGDLLFFGSASAPGHVAIYSGNGYMIESPKEGEYLQEVPMRSYSIAKRIIPYVQVSPFALSVNSSSVPLLKDYMVTQSRFYLCSLPDSSATTNDYLDYGAKVNVYAQSNGWYLVNNQNPQWIPAEYVMPTNQLQPVATGFVTASTGICRENPDSNELDTGDLPYESTVNIYEGYGHFYLVNCSKSIQWMDLDTVKITSMPNIPTANSSTQPISTYYAPAGTKCYEFPMNNINNINGTIDTGKTVNVYAQYGNWYLVNNGVPQWIQHN